MTDLKKQLSMWNNHQTYSWWASDIRLTPINIYINDPEVNIKSLQIKFVNDRESGRVANIDESTALTE